MTIRTPTRMEISPSAREILSSEHNHNEWIGPKLLAVANYFRSDALDRDDYERWVLASFLWSSYEDSTRDSVTEQRRNLERAWEKSSETKPFDLHESLTTLRRRVVEARWPGRAGPRDRAVALSFIDFCQENNCFTRTLSSYELAKWTPGFSPRTVDRGLQALEVRGLLTVVPRTDTTPGKRTTVQRQLNLDWRDLSSFIPERSLDDVSDAISTVGRLIASDTSTTELVAHDLWSNKGLGQSPGRVYQVLGPEFVTLKTVAAQARMTESATRRALGKLYEHGLVMRRGRRPVEYRRNEDMTPDLIADALGVTGAIKANVEKIIARQEANELYKATFSTDAYRIGALYNRRKDS